MDKLNIYICENYFPEFNKVVEVEGFDDVVITPYPCMCQNKNNKTKTHKILQDCADNKDNGLVFCGKTCDVIKLIPKDSPFEIKSTNYCFNHLANKQLLDYILQKGGYIVSLGWLNNWRKYIEVSGFDKDTARLFYKDFCKELIFFDAGIDANYEENLKELSEFLDLPYIVIPYQLEIIQLMIKSAVFEWRLHRVNSQYTNSISEFQSQCAEYSTILDLIGKISSYTNKCDAIDKIKEIFVMVLGAQKFKYWNFDYKDDNLSDEIKDLFSNDDKLFIFSKQENRFCIKIRQQDNIYGAIDVGDFLFPKYIEKYLNFAIEIANVCGLALLNIEQYEKLIKSEKDLQYLSFHDSLTGLYNRTYLKEILNVNDYSKYLAVFMFDIDRLKYVNDNFGHLEGDKLILSISDILKKCFRENDTVARIGGDEFVAILQDCDMEMAQTFSDRINNEIQLNNKNIKEQHLELSVSVGFVVSDYNKITLEALVHKADELMYINKRKKKEGNLYKN